MNADPLVPVGEGRTALSEEDRYGLIPTWIATRGDLNDAEQHNITQALLRRPPTTDQLLDDAFLRSLHKRMFGQVWLWAGRYRRRETNIGVAPEQIAQAIRALTEDAKAWVEHAVYAPEEAAARFHHRLVATHPFPNGNGRFGRAAADYLVNALGATSFTWGAGLNLRTDDLRGKYLDALQRADRGDISGLMAFART